MSEPAGSTLTGIGLKLVSVAMFVGMSSCIKLAGEVPAGQIVFYRSFFATIPVLGLLAMRRQLRTALRTRDPLGHLTRGLVGVASMTLTFMALTRLPLPEAIALSYAQPLLVVVFSAIFLGETVRLYRWSAVTVGLAGVVIISWPKLTLLTSGDPVSASELVGVATAIGGAVMAAAAALLIRRLVQTEASATIVLWFSLIASAAGLLTIPFGWLNLTWTQQAALVASGIFGGFGQILLTQAYRHAEASTVAPFEYTSMILGIAAGYLLFADIPSSTTLAGGAIVILAGIFIVWRERQLGIERARLREHAQ